MSYVSAWCLAWPVAEKLYFALLLSSGTHLLDYPVKQETSVVWIREEKQWEIEIYLSYMVNDNSIEACEICEQHTTVCSVFAPRPHAIKLVMT